MKKNLIFSFIPAMLISAIAPGQIKQLPEVTLYTMDGIAISASNITNDSMPMLMCFWKTYDNECCEQLAQLYNAYDETLRPQGVKMIAICVDGGGCVQHVKPFIYGHDFDMEVYIDKNGDFKRIMGIADAPYNILFDQYMSIYCRYSGACSNVDEMACQKINECMALMEMDN